MKYNKAGFTLIELLVVVLIIGILAAVAMPQYQKSVEKSRATQALALLKTVYQAYLSSYMAQGEDPTDFAQLDVDIPWTGHRYYSFYDSNATKTIRSNQDWAMDLYADTGITRGVCIVRLQGNYQGNGFCIFRSNNSQLSPHTLYCIERSGGAITRTGERGSYCHTLWNATYTGVGGYLEVFKLP